MASLPDFPLFNAHEDCNAGLRWKTCLTRFERLLCGLHIIAADSCTKLALMSMTSTILCRLAATKTTKP